MAVPGAAGPKRHAARATRSRSSSLESISKAGKSLPGDELIASADLTATRAVTIRGPGRPRLAVDRPARPGRGGFYSYDVLENKFGCDIHRADRIVPEWQDVGAGDEVRLAPEVALVVGSLGLDGSSIVFS